MTIKHVIEARWDALPPEPYPVVYRFYTSHLSTINRVLEIKRIIYEDGSSVYLTVRPVTRTEKPNPFGYDGFGWIIREIMRRKDMKGVIRLPIPSRHAAGLLK